MSRNDVLVTADWAQENLGSPGIVFVEVDEDASAYDKGHIEGAVKLDWKTDLQDPLRRDFVDREQFEKLLSEKGVANDDTVVLYGGNNNWFAAYAYWYFKLYGHSDVKLIDGGRKKWELDSRPLSSDVVTRPATVDQLDVGVAVDRKSTRLNSSHMSISYAVFCYRAHRDLHSFPTRRSSDLVLYGGNNNWFAAYAYWYFKLYGHSDVKLIDGGRKKWELDSRPLSSDVVTRPATVDQLDVGVA